jgi:hypothetical protein
MDLSRIHIKLPCPNFANGKDVTPKTVRAILEWSFGENEGLCEGINEGLFEGLKSFNAVCVTWELRLRPTLQNNFMIP